MPRCVLLNCNSPKNSSSQRQGHISYHSFPHDPIIKEKWIAATGRKDWFPTKYSTICSIHFENTSFIEGKNLRLLKKTAYPTIDILKLIDNNDEVVKKRKLPMNRDGIQYLTRKERKKKHESDVVHTEDLPTTPPVVVGSVCVQQTAHQAAEKKTPEKLKIQESGADAVNPAEVLKALAKSREVARRRLSTTKKLRESKRRLEKKHANLLEDLKSKNFMQTESFHFLSGIGSKTQDSKPSFIIPEPRQQKAKTSSKNAGESASHIEPIGNVNSDYGTSILRVETIDTHALARIRANPQFYIGIPKNCYHLIDIIHEQTKIPTTHILLCLKKIKLDTHFVELADQFGITTDEARYIFTLNVPALASILHCFVDKHDLQIPLQSEYSTCVIDSLEINVQPSSAHSRQLTQTERGNTVKYMVCCTPDGYINYVSPGYGGRLSDERLLEDTKYLDRLKSGDSVVPNGLRNVDTMLLQKGLKVVKPRARQKDCAKFCTTQDSTTNESQPSEDQIKRLVQRIREFKMVKDHNSALSCELVRVLDEAVVISCALINLQSFVIN